jgi:hypothetical protein
LLWELVSRSGIVNIVLFPPPSVVAVAMVEWVTCGRRLGKNFLPLLQIGRVRSRVRPVCAARVAAGHNALRRSGPYRKHAFEDALTQAGSPDLRNDRICITSSCPRQFGVSFCLPLIAMPPAAASTP